MTPAVPFGSSPMTKPKVTYTFQVISAQNKLLIHNYRLIDYGISIVKQFDLYIKSLKANATARQLLANEPVRDELAYKPRSHIPISQVLIRLHIYSQKRKNLDVRIARNVKVFKKTSKDVRFWQNTTKRLT